MKGRRTPLDLAWNVRLGAWGTDVTMTRNVASVRQNLTPLVTGGRPTPMVATRTWRLWGSTCSATSCGQGLPGVEHQWRSGRGKLLASTDHGPDTFFNPAWPRDFITMSARPAATG